MPELSTFDSWWLWWSLALLLVVLEIFSPGVFFIWLGVAAGLTGAINVLYPELTWQYQALFFSLLTIISMIFWHRYSKKHALETDQPLLNQRSAQYIGRTFSLTEAISNGRGKISVDDSQWQVQGADCPVGSKVRVIAVQGMILEVELLDNSASSD